MPKERTEEGKRVKAGKKLSDIEQLMIALSIQRTISIDQTEAIRENTKTIAHYSAKQSESSKQMNNLTLILIACSGIALYVATIPLGFSMTITAMAGFFGTMAMIIHGDKELLKKQSLGKKK